MMNLDRPSENLRLTDIEYMILREQILETEGCSLGSLRDPSRWTSLPFPSLFCQLPLDRFSLNPDGTFRFMGREIFAEVYQVVSNMSRRTGKIYSLQGSSGTGKSHILAALACLLVKEGKRVVYLPNAKVLAAMMVVYTKEALKLTYADDEELFRRIQGFSLTVEVLQFIQEREEQGEELYIICGQMDTLRRFPDTADANGPRVQDEALTSILQLSMWHNFIWSASGNCWASSDTALQTSGARHLLLRQGYNRVCSSRFVEIMSHSF